MAGRRRQPKSQVVVSDPEPEDKPVEAVLEVDPDPEAEGTVELDPESELPGTIETTDPKDAEKLEEALAERREEMVLVEWLGTRRGLEEYHGVVDLVPGQSKLVTVEQAAYLVEQFGDLVVVIEAD